MALIIAQDGEKSEGLCNLHITEDLTIYVVNELKQALSEQLDQYTGFELSLADVEEVDSAGIQLLLALAAELKRQEKSFKLTAMSAAVEKLIENYGVSNRFKTGDIS